MNTDLKPFLEKIRPKDLKVIAEQTGVPLHTILKIKTGETSNPRVETWAALATYFGIRCGIQRRA